MPVMIIVVRGLVQGVGFRWWASRTARGLGIDGWVVNLPDGSVEITVSGDVSSVAEMENLCRQGPGGAIVESVVSTSSDIRVGPGFKVVGSHDS